MMYVVFDYLAKLETEEKPEHSAQPIFKSLILLYLNVFICLLVLEAQ